MIGQLWSTSTKVVLHSLMTTRPGVLQGLVCTSFFPELKLIFWYVRGEGGGDIRLLLWKNPSYFCFIVLYIISHLQVKAISLHSSCITFVYIVYLHIFFFRHLIMFIHYLINHKTILLYVKKLMKNNKYMILYDSVLN